MRAVWALSVALLLPACQKTPEMGRFGNVFQCDARNNEWILGFYMYNWSPVTSVQFVFQQDNPENVPPPTQTTVTTTDEGPDAADVPQCGQTFSSEVGDYRLVQAWRARVTFADMGMDCSNVGTDHEAYMEDLWWSQPNPDWDTLFAEKRYVAGGSVGPG